MKELNLISDLHNSTKRNYLKRMNNDKVHCMNVARKYSYSFWDGDRKYGYGGYKYIPGRWTKVAKKLIKKFKLTNQSKILDIGCGKGFLLFEIKKILPKIQITGFDISSYGIKKAPKEIRKNFYIHRAQEKTKYKNQYFDLVFTLATLHNLKIYELSKSINEINRISKQAYIMVESYRNEKELFNLQCWALTCESFFSKDEWIWIFKKLKYKGFYEFIYFK